jgi:hypothetical protein
MFNYIPERIYKKIKNDEAYISLVAEITAAKESCKTFEEFIRSDSEEFVGRDRLSNYKKVLAEIVTKYCPEYLIQLKVNEGEYTKPQLIEMYNSNKYDTEYNFFFLSNIINASYDDGTYLEYMEYFINDYEALPLREVSLLSDYVHLKYMYGKIYLNAYNINTDNDRYHYILFDANYSTYMKVLDYVELDILNNYVLEALCDSLQVVANKLEDNTKLYFYLKIILNFANSSLYQYKNYSYAYAKLLDIKNMLDAYSRDYTEFINGTIVLCKYISNALAVPSKLFKGLNYYDKCNHAMFIVLIRKYLKLKESIPVLRVNNSATITNLNPLDYNYAFSNITDIETPSIEHDVVVNQYKMEVDAWFKSDNVVLNCLKDIKI